MGRQISHPSLNADEILLKAGQITTNWKIIPWCQPKNCSSPVKFSHPQNSVPGL